MHSILLTVVIDDILTNRNVTAALGEITFFNNVARLSFFTCNDNFKIREKNLFLASNYLQIAIQLFHHLNRNLWTNKFFYLKCDISIQLFYYLIRHLWSNMLLNCLFYLKTNHCILLWNTMIEVLFYLVVKN